MGAPLAPALTTPRAGIGSEVDIGSKESREGNAARSNTYELHVQTVFFIEPEFLGDPKRSPVSGEGAVGDNQRLEFLLLGSSLNPTTKTSMARQLKICVEASGFLSQGLRMKA